MKVNRTRTVVVLVALLALLGVLAVLWMGGQASQPADAQPGAADAPDLASDAPGAAETAATEMVVLPGPVPAEAPRDVASLAVQAEAILVPGRVTTSDGVPVKGARVAPVVAARWADKYPGTETDADGRYQLMIRAGDTGGNLEASAPGHASRNAWVYFTETGPSPEAIDFVLARLVQLSGRVTWAHDGTPCARASVVVTPVLSSRVDYQAPRLPPLCSTTTDAEGSFRCTLPGEQVVSIAVTPAPSEAPQGSAAPAEGVPHAAATDGAPETSSSESSVKKLVTRVTVPLSVSGEHAIEIEVLQPASVTVVLSETPTAGADGGAPTSEVLADGGGVASPAGELRLMLTPHELPVQEQSPGAPSPLGMPVADSEATFTEVQPLVAWDVALMQGRSMPVFLARGIRFEAGEHARLVLPYDPAALVPVPWPAPKDARGERTMQFRFRFRDGTGRALRFDDMSQQVQLPYDNEFVAEARSLADGSAGTVRLHLGTVEPEGLADVYVAVPPIEMTLRIGDRVWTRAPIANMDMVELELLPLPQSATLRIRTTDAHGNPRTPAVIVVTQCDTWTGQPVLVFSSSEPVVTLAPGAYVVWGRAEMLETEAVRVELAPGEVRTLQLAADVPGTLRGTLEPPPAPGECATVHASPAGGGHPLMVIKAAVGADGRFEFPALPAGTWDLVCLISAPQGGERGPERVVTQRGVNVVSGVLGDVVIPNEPLPAGIVRLRAARAAHVAFRALDGSLQLTCLMLAGETRTISMPAGHYSWQCLDSLVDDERMVVDPPTLFEVSADPATPESVIDI